MLKFLLVRMIWSKIRKVLPFIGIAIFVYLVIKLNIVSIIKQIEKIKIAYVFIALLFLAVYVIFQTTKWYVIARKQKINVPFKDAIRINIITNFYGFVSPARLGSVLRADYLKNYANGLGKGFSNFVIDKVLDLSSIFVLAISLGFVFRSKIGIVSSNSLYILVTIFLALILLSLIFYKKEFSKFFLRIIYRKLVPDRMKEKAKTGFDSFYEDMPRYRFIFLAFIINILTWVTNYIIAYFVGLSLGINISFIYYLAVYPIATLVAQIPITVSGLGTREFTLISLFGLFGVESVKIFSMSIITLVIVDIVPAIIAVFLMLEKNKNDADLNKKKLKRGIKE